MLKKIFWTIILLMLLILYLYLWLTNPPRHHSRFQDTHLNTHLRVSINDSFENYINATSKIIKQARIRGDVNSADTIVKQNSPFILLPDEKICKKTTDNRYQNGILLIHGLLDSPYSMNDISKFFRDKCFAVYVILLPGHGTVPGDLLHVSYQDWIRATHFGAAKLAEQAKNIYIMGYSLGGLLAVNEVLTNPGIFKGAVLFAPALGLKSSYASFIKPAYIISQFVPRLQWLALHADDINVRYESYPLNPVYEIVKLIEKVNHQLDHQSLSIPIFMQQSADDMTVDPLVNLEFFEKNRDKASKILWYSKNVADKHLPDKRIELLNDTVVKLKILDISHLSYLMPITDPIYGLHGSYHDCVYYKEQTMNWRQCKKANDNYLGEITPENVKNYLMQRLTFNPFSDKLYHELGQFIDIISKANP